MGSDTEDGKDKPSVSWTSDDILRAVNRGVYEALKRHKERGESIVVWQDGAIVTLTGEEIDLSCYESLPESEK